MKKNNELFSSGFEFLLFSSEKIETVISEMIDSKKIDRKEAISLRKALIKRSEDEKKRFISDLEKFILSKIESMGFVREEKLLLLEKKINAIETYVDEQARVKKQTN
jgi:hypothetical protein